MTKDKLIITVEVDDFPANASVLDFQVLIIEDGWLSRVFKNWKKISYRRAAVTKMDLEKV